MSRAGAESDNVHTVNGFILLARSSEANEAVFAGDRASFFTNQSIDNQIYPIERRVILLLASLN